MVYYVYGVWESICYITSMVSGSLYVLSNSHSTFIKIGEIFMGRIFSKEHT
jgi:hypothetical protein